MIYPRWVQCSETLPPVGCPIVILQGVTPRRCERLGHVESKQRALTYHMRNGSVIAGRFPWTYP